MTKFELDNLIQSIIEDVYSEIESMIATHEAIDSTDAFRIADYLCNIAFLGHTDATVVANMLQERNIITPATHADVINYIDSPTWLNISLLLQDQAC